MRILILASILAGAPALGGELLTPHDNATVTESGSTVGLQQLDQGPTGLLVSRQLSSATEADSLGEGYLVLDASNNVLVVLVDKRTTLQDVATRINRSDLPFAARVIPDMDGVRLFVAVNSTTSEMLSSLAPLSSQWADAIAASL